MTKVVRELIRDLAVKLILVGIGIILILSIWFWPVVVARAYYVCWGVQCLSKWTTHDSKLLSLTSQTCITYSKEFYPPRGGDFASSEVRDAIRTYFYLQSILGARTLHIVIDDRLPIIALVGSEVHVEKLAIQLGANPNDDFEWCGNRVKLELR